MLEENIRKIIELRHDAPYEVLGPHYDNRERTLTIRAFLPQAERVYLAPLDGTAKREMRRLHPDGLFVLQIPGVAKLDYQLTAVAADGYAFTFHDPYAIHATSFTDAAGQALQQGTLNALYGQLGAHPVSKNGIAGVNFALWAPYASRVSVVGTFNQWDGRRHPMERHTSGIRSRGSAQAICTNSRFAMPRVRYFSRPIRWRFRPKSIPAPPHRSAISKSFTHGEIAPGWRRLRKRLLGNCRSLFIGSHWMKTPAMVNC